MTEIEKVLAQIGEFVFVEMGGIKSINYETDEDGKQTSFMMLTDDGKEYIIGIKPNNEIAYATKCGT